MVKKIKAVKAKSNWKTVKLDDGMLARGIPQELVGIEELRDYKLVKRNFKKPVRTSSELKSEKVIVQTDSKNDIVEDYEQQETKQRPAKKKKINQKKSNVEKKDKQSKENEELLGKNEVEDTSENITDEVYNYLPNYFLNLKCSTFHIYFKFL